MQTFRIVVSHEGLELGHFTTTAPDGARAAELVSNCLRSEGGFDLQRQVSAGEYRIIESQPSGLRVLSTQVQFKNAE
jgi:hypothetical protein